MRRIVTVGILVGLMLLVSFPSISQTSKLDQKIALTPGNRTIEAVLEEIEHITDLRFSYSSDLVPVDKTVSVTGRPEKLKGTRALGVESQD